jgi:Fe-S oxidoreductase/nitrate reductase gamma subunit
MEWNWDEITRQTYIGLTPVEKVLFYLLIFASIGVIVGWYWSRLRLWRQGKPDEAVQPLRQRLWQMITYAFGQKKVPRHRFAALFHLPLYVGFVILAIGTTLLAIAEWTEIGSRLLLQEGIWFHKGLYFILYEVSLDLFGLGVIVGCLLALWRRHLQRPASLSRHPLDALSVWLLLLIALTGYMLEAARIALERNPAFLNPPRPDYAQVWSFVGYTLAPLFEGITVGTYKFWWWLHAVLIAAWFASLAFNRVRHLFLAPVVAYYKPHYLPNVPSIERMEQVEQTGKVGVNALRDFARWHLMSLDACMGCGRCERVCPAYATGKPLNPKWIVEKLRDALTQGKGDDLTQVISDEELFACTTCGACNNECPVLIEHPTLIMEMRRYRVAEGNLRGTAAGTLQRLMTQSNPWGLPLAERTRWAEGLKVPTARENPHFELLFWVGCAGAYDSRGQQVARAIVKLLQRAGVNFAILGDEERCTGDTARRLGEELLFQELAMQNRETLNRYQPKRIMTMCPHCLHTLKNEYHRLTDGAAPAWEVVHHTQVLAELIQQGRLPRPTALSEGAVVFHDPCYLARVNRQHEAPRAVLQAAVSALREPPRQRERTFCCGAGGGRMWMEEAPQQRPGLIRAEELLQTGARTVAVGCPFCMIMVGDSVKQKDERVPVKDIAEILLEQIEATNVPPDRAAEDALKASG